jgi:GTPase SAR1 family protein
MANANMLKVIIIGDGGTGKSSLLTRFVNNEFDSQTFHTIGIGRA